jgi:hypothetical protein
MDLRSLPLVGGGAGSGIANPQKHSNVHCKLSDDTQYGPAHSKDTVTTKATTLQTLGKHTASTPQKHNHSKHQQRHGPATAKSQQSGMQRARHKQDMATTRYNQGNGKTMATTRQEQCQTR